MQMRPITALRALLAALLCGLAQAAGAQIEIDTVAVDSMVVVTEAPKPAPPLRFAYISYATALKAMPGYAAAGKRLEELKAKYEEFLEGQASFPESILRKRQSELQELLERNMAFKEESRRLLQAAERDIYAPLHRCLREAIRTVGRQNGYAFVINIDGDACPYIDTSVGDNVTLMVIDMLK